MSDLGPSHGSFRLKFSLRLWGLDKARLLGCVWIWRVSNSCLVELGVFLSRSCLGMEGNSLFWLFFNNGQEGRWKQRYWAGDKGVTELPSADFSWC